MNSAPSASSSDREVRFVVAGDGYAVTCDDEAIREALVRWTTLLAGESGEPARFALRTRGEGAPAIEREGGVSSTLESSEDLLPVLEGVLYARMAQRTPRLQVLHAAALARHGKAVVFLGPSGAGKSVLSLSLCERGWTYLSDEFAPLDEHGRVVAVPRPVSFDPDEIPAELLARITRGRVSWSRRYRAQSGGYRRVVHVLPERAAPSGASFSVAAYFRLEPRPGAAPGIRRMSPPEARAFLFAAISGAPRS
jgi:hypothetical protein